MLKKMKARLKNEKGFTLVELLAVIAILAIILAIAIPSIGSVVSKAKEDAHEANESLFENAARLAYVSGNTESSITLDDLVSKGFLEEIPEDPNTGAPYTSTLTVTNNNGSDFEFNYPEGDSGGG